MPVHMVASPRKTPRATTPRAPLVADAPAPASPQFGGPKSAPPAVFRTCSNCGKADILAANIVLHEAHCCRHYRRCEYCSVLLEVRAVDAHVAEMRGTLETLVDALEADNPTAVKNALDHGVAEHVALSAKDERRGATTVLHLACGKDRAEYHALVAQLIRAGADVHARNNLGWTPLHVAAKAGSSATIASLLAAGADASARDPLGHTPLELASGEESKAALLFAGGAVMPGSSRGSSRSSSRASHGGGVSPSDSAIGSRRASSENLAALTTVPGLAGAFERDLTLGLPRPPSGRLERPLSSSRPSSSRHAQRLRSMVHQAPMGGGEDPRPYNLR